MDIEPHVLPIAYLAESVQALGIKLAVLHQEPISSLLCPLLLLLQCFDRLGSIYLQLSQLPLQPPYRLAQDLKGKPFGSLYIDQD